jgi:peptidoglycan/LPS O-acetylase OafA/YrhL
MLVFSVFCSAAIQYYLGDKSTLDLAGVLATATLTTDIFGKEMTLGVIWTLIIEFQFYLLLAILGPVTQKKILITCVIITSFSAASFLFGFKSKIVLADLYFIVYMLIGSSARLAFERRKLGGSVLCLACPALVITAFGINRYVTVHLLAVNPGQEINVISQIVTALLFMLFAVTGGLITRSATSKFLVEKSSDLTYSVYLMHMAVGSYFISKFRHISPNEYTTILFTFVVVTVVAAVTYVTIEKPGIRLFKNLSRPIKPTAATTTT